MSADQAKSRFQFKLRDVFIATFWAAIWCSACIATFEAVGRVVALWIMIGLFRVIGPFVAIGALHRRAWMGAIIGIAVVVVYAAVVYVAIDNGWLDFP
jgi:Na+/glutamate symporter